MNLYEDINKCKLEKDIQYVYEKALEKIFSKEEHFSIATETGAQTDTFFQDVNINGILFNVLCEYKNDDSKVNLKYQKDFNKVIAQTVFYIHKIIDSGEIEVPKIIFIGDNKYYSFFHVNKIISYAMDNDIDFSGKPCQACFNTTLMEKLNNDENINSIRLFSVKEDDLYNDGFVYVVSLIKEKTEKIKATENNVVKLYNRFSSMFVGLKEEDFEKRATYFIMLFTDPDKCIVGTKTIKFLINNKVEEIYINKSVYNNFKENINFEYSPSEKDRFISIRDRLIDDAKRRRNGEFYTPQIAVDLAYKLAIESIGNSWRENPVWDCCCGTGNLTRGVSFKELYSSSIEENEIKLTKKYNREAFVYDFLDGRREELLEKSPGLLNALRNNSPITFFINPPYATSSNGLGKEHKEGVNERSKITQEEFSNIGFNFTVENLYGQFLERICWFKKTYNLTDVKIILFSPTLFLTGTKWKNFRKEFFKYFNFVKGAQFNASVFSGTKSSWSIGITIWDSKENITKNEFNFGNYEIGNDYTLVEKNIIKLYNTDNIQEMNCMDWLKEGNRKEVVFDAPTFSSGVKQKHRTSSCGVFHKSFGYMLCKMNNISGSKSSTAIFSSVFSDGHGTPITENNFEKCCAVFAARKSIVCTAENSKQEYLKPDIDTQEYEDYVADGVIFSLFDTSSNQTSLRNIDYAGEKNIMKIQDSPTMKCINNINLWDIKNNFFWMPNAVIKDLANKYKFDDIYNDANGDFERFVYLWLKNHKLSKNGIDILEAANKIVVDTFKYRNEYCDNINYQLDQVWDAGWYQVKALAKTYTPELLKKFNDMFASFKDEIAYNTYQVGFLK